MSVLLEGNNASKIFEVASEVFSRAFGSNKRKSEFPADDNDNETSGKRKVKINPNFFKGTLKMRGAVCDLQDDIVTLRKISGTENQQGRSSDDEISFSLKGLRLEITKIEIADVLNVEGTYKRHEEISESNFTVTSIHQEIVTGAKEKVVKINSEDIFGEKFTYIAFENIETRDDNDLKSFFIMKPDSQLEILEDQRYKVKKLRVHHRQVEQLDDEFSFRVIDVLTQGIDEIMKKVSVRFKHVNFLQNLYLDRKLTLEVENNSEEASLKLIAVELEEISNEVVIKLLEIPKDNMNYNIRRNRPYFIDLKVKPHVIGKFGAELKFNFKNCLDEMFHKKLKIFFEVSSQFSTSSQLPPRVECGIRFQDVKIRNRVIPEKLRRVVSLENTDKAFNTIETMYPCLEHAAKMTKKDFKEILSLEENFEELYREKAFSELMDKSSRNGLSTFQKSENNLMKLMVKGIGESRPSIGIGDKIIAMNPFTENCEIYIGRIVAVEMDALTLKFNESFQPESHFYEIQIEFSKSIINSFHHAINTIEGKIGADNLFPEYNTHNENIKHPIVPVVLKGSNMCVNEVEHPWKDEELDEYQKEAVIKALRCEYRPIAMIIHGPPGTGKTKTLVEIVVQLRRLTPNRKIIISTPSNSAANIFVEKFMKIAELQKSFIRLVSFNQSERQQIPEHIMPFCATVDVSSDISLIDDECDQIEEDERIPKYNKKQISSFSIIITTLCCSSQLMKIKFDFAFDTVIVDEAGQATEAETYLPLTQLSQHGGHVILAGDHLQLGPCAFSPFTKRFKLRKSLLERLVMENECYSDKCHDNVMLPSLCTILKKNYRALPSILKVYNELFYNNQLEETVNEQKSDEVDLLRHLQTDVLWKSPTVNNCGVYMIDVTNGRNTRKQQKSYSWYNQKELDSLQSFLSKLHSDDENVMATDIGIITPYVLQRDKIYNSVLKNFSRFETVKVGTVEEFQGQERQIICLSLVRTDPKQFKFDEQLNLGFMACEKRLNVSISRAKCLLVIFTKCQVLENHPKWKSVLDYAKKNSRYFVDER